MEQRKDLRIEVNGPGRRQQRAEAAPDRVHQSAPGHTKKLAISHEDCAGDVENQIAARKPINNGGVRVVV